jgi:hypothetical protein
MSEVFSCPACTGRLEYEGGRQLTVKCPYCGNTVIVPESLRAAQGNVPADHEVDEALQDILDLLNSGNKIAAIKEFHQQYGGTLRAAKEAVDALEAGQNMPATIDISSINTAATVRRAGMGCIFTLVLLAAGVLAAIIFVIYPLLSGRNGAETQQAMAESGLSLPTLPGETAPLMTSVAQSATPEAPDPVVLRFGTRGINPGEFNDPRAITIGTGGTLYVADYQGGRVQRFDASGSYVDSWALQPDRVISAMAADRNNNLYMVQAGDLNRYDQSSGELLGSLHYQSSNLVSFADVAAATNGDVVAVNHFGELVRFDSAGNLLQLMPIEDVADAVSFSKVAVDGVGNVYVLGRYEDALGDRHDGIFIFNNRGQYVQRFGQKGNGAGDFTSPAALTVDGQGRIYVSDFAGILVFANSGSYLTTLPDEGFIFGMVINDAGELIATGNANQVVKYARLE